MLRQMHCGVEPTHGTVENKSRLGSRPSAITIFNLPIAVPLGHRCRAWLSEPLNCFTKPLSISSCTNLLSSAGLFSAASQLPLQCSSDAGLKSCEKSKDSCAGGHCPLPGSGPKAPVGTPSSKMMGSCASLSCIVCARLCSTLSRKGWPSDMCRNLPKSVLGAKVLCTIDANAMPCSSERGGSSLLSLRWLEMFN